MAKYTAKSSIKHASLKGTGLGLGEIQCLLRGGKIILEDVPESLAEHLEECGTKKTVKKVKVKEGDK